MGGACGVGGGLHLHMAMFLHIQHGKHTMLPTAQMGTCCLLAWEVSADCLLPPVLSTDPWGCLLVPLAVPTWRPGVGPLGPVLSSAPTGRGGRVGGAPLGSDLTNPLLREHLTEGAVTSSPLMLQSTCLSETVSWHASAGLLSASHCQIQEVLCGPQVLSA